MGQIKMGQIKNENKTQPEVFSIWLKTNLQTLILGIYTEEMDIYALKKTYTNVHSRFIYYSSTMERLSLY